MTSTSRVVFTGKPQTLKSKVHGKASKQSERRCKCCGDLFTARRSTAKYCSADCRVSAWKTRHKPRQRVKPIPVIVSTCCAHCGSRFAASAGRGQVYCTPSCKTLAYRARRSAAIEAWSELSGFDADLILETVERHGMKRVTATLTLAGFVYDQRSRRWLLPVGQGVEVRV